MKSPLTHISYAINKFTLLLKKDVYPYEYMDSWKRFKEESLPDKESFYSELNNEHITDEDYAHAQKVWDTFKIKTLRWVSWPIYSIWFVITCWCIWKL